MKKILIAFFIFLNSNFVFANSCTIDLDWFKGFGDEKLMNYIFLAMENNNDIKIAKNNILKFTQDKNLNISDEFPNFSIGSNYLLLKVPQLAIPNNDIQTNSYALPFLTIWEIDYLGKKYNKITKSKIDIENSCYDLKAINLMTAVDVASNYFNISNTEKQILLQEKILSLSKNLYEKNRKKFEYGYISLFELNNYKNLVLEEENYLLNLYKNKMLFINNLLYLIGKSPYMTDLISVTPFDEIDYKGKYFDFIKGNAILNRPDILKAENEIKKAKIDITIAKKDFLPSINLFGVLSFSTIVQNFNWKGALAALSAGAMQNLFDGGRRFFTLKKRKIEYETKIEEYLKADLNALKEVNDVLYTLKIDYKIYQNNLAKMVVSSDNLTKVFDSYNKGAKSHLDYLSENSNYIKQEILLADSKNKNLINLLSLYKALGGIMPE